MSSSLERKKKRGKSIFFESRYALRERSMTAKEQLQLWGGGVGGQGRREEQ
jgi:hypothetical protein